MQTIPEIGQLAIVRKRPFVVTEIIPSTPGLSGEATKTNHLIKLSSVEDDGLGEELAALALETALMNIGCFVWPPWVLFLFRVAFGVSRAKNAVEQRHACAPFRQHLAERYSDELFRGFIQQAAKGGVDIAHDVAGSLHCGHRQRRVLGDRQAEARQVGRLMR